MVKVVYNACYGGHGLSDDAIKLLMEKKGYTPTEKVKKYSWDEKWTCQKGFSWKDVSRHDTDLVAVVEELGANKASGSFAKLGIVDIGDCDSYRIDEYDGAEAVVTRDDYEWIQI